MEHPKIPADQQPEHFPPMLVGTRGSLVVKLTDGSIHTVEVTIPPEEVRIDDPELREVFPPEE